MLKSGIMKIRVGHLSTFYHTAMLLIASAAEGAGLPGDLEWDLFATGPDIVNAFRHGLLDIAYIGLAPAIIGMDRGVKIKCVSGGHIEGTVLSGGKEFKAYPGVPGLREALEQFKSKKIGVPGRGSIHDVVLSDALSRYGLVGSIEVINFKWADAITEAVSKNQIQAALGTPALAVAIKRYAEGQVLCPPHLIWPGNPSYGIVASEEFIESRPDALETFLRVHEEASAELRENPAQCARKISAYTGLVDKEFVLEAINMSPKYCAQLTENYMTVTMDFASALKKLGYIGGGKEKDLSRQDIFETGFIKKVHPAGDHYGG